MTNNIDQTHWTVKSQYYNVTTSGIQDNNSGNYTNLDSNSNINFQNDNTIQVTTLIGTQVSNTGLQCRRDAAGNNIQVAFGPTQAAISLSNHDIPFNWNSSPGTHVLTVSCVGNNVTASEDGVTLISVDLPVTIVGTYYEFNFGQGNNTYSNWQYCDNAGCSSSTPSPTPTPTPTPTPSVLFSDPMTNNIDQTHWTVKSQYYNVTSSGIQDNNSGNYTNLDSNSNINFQNDNTFQVTTQVGSQVSNLGIQCRRDAVGDLIQVAFGPTQAAISYGYNGQNHDYPFSWNSSPGTHVLTVSCIGFHVTASEDGTVLASMDLPNFIWGSYYELNFGLGNNIFTHGSLILLDSWQD